MFLSFRDREGRQQRPGPAQRAQWRRAREVARYEAVSFIQKPFEAPAHQAALAAFDAQIVALRSAEAVALGAAAAADEANMAQYSQCDGEEAARGEVDSDSRVAELLGRRAAKRAEPDALG